MKNNIARRLKARKVRIARRLAAARAARFERGGDGHGTVLHARGVKYELAEKSQGIAYGGVGVMLRLADEVGLVAAIDERLQLLQWHAPYRESDMC